jgi:hypothetical protein
MLDDLEGIVDEGDFGEGFHEGAASLISAEYPESIIVSTVCIGGVGWAWILQGAEKKLEAGKMLENAAEFPPPNVRCVWQRFSSFLYE